MAPSRSPITVRFVRYPLGTFSTAGSAPERCGASSSASSSRLTPSPMVGLGQDGVADLLVTQAAEHRHLDDGGDLPGVVTEEGHAEYLVCVGVCDGLPHPDRLVQRCGSGSRSRRHG